MSLLKFLPEFYMKLPLVSGRYMLKYLAKRGFSVMRQKGSHVCMHKKEADKTIIVIVPMKDEIKRGTLLSILRQAGIEKEGFKEEI